MKANGVNVNCKKLINTCDIPVSRFTVARYLKQQGMMYKKIRRRFPLKPLDNMKRCDLSKRWLSGNFPWKRIIFLDEKWFFLDGPDD